ncbi:MAG: Gfo/Idh/MocA family oxidoreductase [Gemmatimonadetes bacterium]|nr:Gfo/Idh/MocA family oxidoreductase [Gemmatimonadota bacterium]
MPNIGIIGAENSHTVAIAKTINIDQLVSGFSVTHVWGETPDDAKDAQERGLIPNIVEEPEDLIGEVDAAIVDHRHPKYHLPAVRPLLEAKIPLFVDKPFCYRLDEGKEFLARARELNVPVCSFSVLPKQASFAQLQEDVRELGRIISVVSTGPCDIDSEYGGVFFYGIHQVDMVVRLLDQDITHVQLNRGRQNHTATVYSASGAISTMNLVGEGRVGFHVSVIGEKGRTDRVIGYDENTYLTGVLDFCRMFSTGETDETDSSMLTPVAVLEALEKSQESEEKCEVRKLSRRSGIPAANATIR